MTVKFTEKNKCTTHFSSCWHGWTEDWLLSMMITITMETIFPVIMILITVVFTDLSYHHHLHNKAGISLWKLGTMEIILHWSKKRSLSHSEMCPPVASPCDCCHPLERAAVNCVILSGPSVPCMQWAETWWGSSVNTASQAAHMSTFWNISLTLRLSKKRSADSQAQRTQWERTCGITFKCNQSSANQTIKWKRTPLRRSAGLSMF